MCNFTTNKSVTITHYDDHFRFVVYTEDEPPTITIAYQERGTDSKYYTVNKIEGLWKESGKKVAYAILELVDLIVDEELDK